MTLRLDQFVSQATGLSRKQAGQYIRQKRVLIAGQSTIKAGQQVAPDANILLDNQPLTLPGNIYLMLNKPAGVVSATHDATQRTVMECVDHPHAHTLHIVGRLDKDTTGLLLLTNDGQWSHRISSPRHHVAKTYLVTLTEALDESAAEKLRIGIQLKGEVKSTQPAQVEILPEQQARIIIHEGKYHQVKRMFAAVGYHVCALHREQIGEWRLPEDLASGEWRELSIGLPEPDSECL